jgi:hypothetical protein
MISDFLLEALKIACICGFVSLTGWIVLYTKMAPWWQNPIGRTLVAKTMLVAGLLVPATLSLFFPHLNGTFVSWADFSLIALITPVMIWRSVVWIKLYRIGRLGNGSGGSATSIEGESRYDNGSV